MANISLKTLITEAEDFKARSKETGKLVHFKSKDAYQAAIKAGSHEDPKAEKGEQPKADKKPNSMFGGDYTKDRGVEAPKVDGMATVNSIAAKTGLRAQAVAGWADENGVNLSKVSDDLESKKLKPFDLTTAVVGKPGNNYSKAIIAKYSQSSETKPTSANMGVDKVVYNTRTKTVGIVRMADERGETKTDADGNVNTSELEPYNPMKYPHQKDAKVAPSTSKEVEARGLWTPFAPDSDSTKLTSMIPKKEKSITDIKVDKQVDVSMISKSILPNLRLADGSGYPDKDAVELKKRLDSEDSGVYTRTSPSGGNIVFKDGTKFEVFRPHDFTKTKSTTIYASKR